MPGLGTRGATYSHSQDSYGSIAVHKVSLHVITIRINFGRTPSFRIAIRFATIIRIRPITVIPTVIVWEGTWSWLSKTYKISTWSRTYWQQHHKYFRTATQQPITTSSSILPPKAKPIQFRVYEKINKASTKSIGKRATTIMSWQRAL